MATISREPRQVPVALPQAGRGDAVFGVLAVLIGFAAIMVKLSGLFG